MPSMVWVALRLINKDFQPVTGCTLTSGTFLDLRELGDTFSFRISWHISQTQKYFATVSSIKYVHAHKCSTKDLNLSLSLSYAEYPLAQSVSPPVLGRWSYQFSFTPNSVRTIWRCVIPGNCEPEASACHKCVEPMFKNLGGGKSLSQMTWTPGNPGTCWA